MIRREEVQNNFANAPRNILEFTRVHETTLDTLIEMGLISRRRTCFSEDCDGIMTWIRESTRPDGFIFRCSTCDSKCSKAAAPFSKVLILHSWSSLEFTSITSSIEFQSKGVLVSLVYPRKL